MNYEPQLPANVDAEAAVLGSVLLDRDAIIAVAPWLKPDNFYLEKHRWIYTVMLELYATRTSADLITVSEGLRQRGQLVEVGDIGGLAMLADAVPTAYHVEYYAKIVRDTALARAVIQAGGAIAAAGYDTPDREALVQKATALLEQTTQQSRASRLLMASQASRQWQEYFSSDHPIGQPTGLRSLDQMLVGGMHRGDLIILAARPSVGKTALALQIARNIARDGDLVLYVSLEMKGVPSLWQRLLGIESGIDTKRIQLGRRVMGDPEIARLVEADGRLSEYPLAIDDDFSGSAFDVRSRALALQAELGRVSCVVVDYLQLLNGPGEGKKRSDENRAREVGEMSRSLKQLAGALDCPVIAVSQLNRGVESRADKTPLLSDLRESGNLEQDADLVWFLVRSDDALEHMIELHIAKHRNGPLGRVPLRFEKESGRWFDIDGFAPVEGY